MERFSPGGAHREGAQGKDAVAGELGAGQVEVAQLREAGQEERGAISDARVCGERQVAQAREPHQLLHALVADATAAYLQPLQRPERPDQATQRADYPWPHHAREHKKVKPTAWSGGKLRHSNTKLQHPWPDRRGNGRCICVKQCDPFPDRRH